MHGCAPSAWDWKHFPDSLHFYFSNLEQSRSGTRTKQETPLERFGWLFVRVIRLLKVDVSSFYEILMHLETSVPLSLSLLLRKRACAFGERAEYSEAEAALNVSSKLNKNNPRSAESARQSRVVRVRWRTQVHDTIPFLSPLRKLHPARCTRRVRARTLVWIQSRSPCGYRGGRIITVIASARLRALSHGIPRVGIRHGTEEHRKRKEGNVREMFRALPPSIVGLPLPPPWYRRLRRIIAAITDCRNKYKLAPLRCAPAWWRTVARATGATYIDRRGGLFVLRRVRGNDYIDSFSFKAANIRTYVRRHGRRPETFVGGRDFAAESSMPSFPRRFQVLAFRLPLSKIHCQWDSRIQLRFAFPSYRRVFIMGRRRRDYFGGLSKLNVSLWRVLASFEHWM